MFEEYLIDKNICLYPETMTVGQSLEELKVCKEVHCKLVTNNFWMNNKTIKNYWIQLLYDVKIYANLGGCYPPQPSISLGGWHPPWSAQFFTSYSASFNNCLLFVVLKTEVLAHTFWHLVLFQSSNFCNSLHQKGKTCIVKKYQRA